MTTFDNDRLLNSNEVCLHFGNVCKMTLWRWMRDERVQFPRPVKIQRNNYWREAELRRWQANQRKVAA